MENEKNQCNYAAISDVINTACKVSSYNVIFENKNQKTERKKKTPEIPLNFVATDEGVYVKVAA